MANLVTHPRYGVTKKYLVLLEGKVGRSTVRRFAEGIMLDDGMAKALSARIVDQNGDQTMIEMTMGEGRNREIRRMAESVGYRVVRLVRTAIGPIVDGRLRSGDSRRLSPDEVWSLTRSATDHQ
jgi:pseudouridine synthase